MPDTNTKILKPMSENARKVFVFLRDNSDMDYTAADVAEAVSLPKKVVDAVFTSVICRRKIGYREEVEVENEDGTHATAKFLKLTDEGMDYDPDIEHEVPAD